MHCVSVPSFSSTLSCVAEDVTALLSSLNPDDFEDGIPLDTSAINSLLKLRSDVNSALKRLRQEEEAASTAITGVRERCWADAIRAVKYCANSCEEVTEWFNNECGNVREFVVCDDGAAGKTVEDMKAALLSTAQGQCSGCITTCLAADVKCVM